MSTLDLRLPVGRLTHFAGFSSRPGLREANSFARNASACERPVLHEVLHSGTSPVIALPEGCSTGGNQGPAVVLWHYLCRTLPGLYGASSCFPLCLTNKCTSRCVCDEYAGTCLGRGRGSSRELGTRERHQQSMSRTPEYLDSSILVREERVGARAALNLGRSRSD